MTLNEALERLEGLLGEERLAIRAIDADRVVALADEKERLMEVLRVGDWTDAGAPRERFRSLVPQLRENGVLLVHARNTARDLVKALTEDPGSSYDASGASSVAGTGRRVAITV